MQWSFVRMFGYDNRICYGEHVKRTQAIKEKGISFLDYIAVAASNWIRTTSEQQMNLFSLHFSHL